MATNRRRKAIREALRCFCVLGLILGCGFWSVGEARPGEDERGGSRHPGARFAIADFDGDQRPDLASVEVRDESARVASYSIHLQFSSAPAWEIGIKAPQGGLQIASRDVNGDDLDDLIITAMFDSHLVAVLVNEGHGKFSLAQPGAFPALENETGTKLGPIAAPMYEQSTLALTRSNSGVEREISRPHGSLDAESYLPVPGQPHDLQSFVHPRGGRAPPVFVLWA